MIPILYEKDETSFTSNGIGRLVDATECIVTEKRNSSYELKMSYPVTGKLFSELSVDRIIGCTSFEGSGIQAFLIYKIGRPSSGTVSVSARHISTLLSFIPVVPQTATASNASAALQLLKSAAAADCPFTFESDDDTQATFSITAPSTLNSKLRGSTGSILDLYGGEFEWDNWTVKHHSARGTDSGVTLRYGKNITKLKATQDSSAAYSGVLCYYSDDTNGAICSDVQSTDTASSFAHPRIQMVDVTSQYDSAPTKDQLNEAAAAYGKANSVSNISSTLEVSFVQLADTEEYKDIAPLERVHLCDAVSVYYPVLGVTAKAKVIETKWNTLLDRYDSITIGSAKTTFTDAVRSASKADISSAAQTQRSFFEQQLADAFTKITGAKTGYIVLDTDDDGHIYQILAMDTPDKSTAQKVLRINQEGIAFSKTGYSGTFTTAWTIDGEFTSDFMTAQMLHCLQIITGVIKTADGASYIDLDNSIIHLAGYATSDDISAVNQNIQSAADTAGKYTDSKVGDLSAALSEKISTAQTKAESAAASDEATRQMLSDYKSQVGQWLNFDSSSGMIIGASGSAMQTQITSDRMAYLYNGKAIAYTSGSQFYVPEIVVTGQISIGNYVIKANDGGEVTIFKKGT